MFARDFVGIDLFSEEKKPIHETARKNFFSHPASLIEIV